MAHIRRFAPPSPVKREKGLSGAAAPFSRLRERAEGATKLQKRLQRRAGNTALTLRRLAFARSYRCCLAWAAVRKVSSWIPTSTTTSAFMRALTFLMSALVILLMSNVSRWSKSIVVSS